MTATAIPLLLYGGARGGGKSDYLIADFLQDVLTYGQHWQGVLFRRTYPELEEIIKRTQQLYPQTGAEWQEQKKQWTWPNGACLKLRYLEAINDSTRYQGHSYTWIGWDELTQWPNDSAFKMLIATLRSAASVPTKRIRCSANPGGPGHHWVKAMFIDPAPGGYQLLHDPDTRINRIYIPARVSDNALLLAQDPGYIDRLRGVGPADIVRAWLDGDWSIIQGAFFDFSYTKHVINPFSIPSHWLRYRAFDWGSASPFCCLWFAYSDGVEIGDSGEHLASEYKRGDLIVYREWYGSNGKPNEGLRLKTEEVAKGILARESLDVKISYGSADPSIWKEDGGPSINEVMANNHCYWQKADNSRKAGWQQIRSRLIGHDDGSSGLYIFDCCPDLIRTLSALRGDDKDPEDVDTKMEDHAPDALRYGCMSRPWTNTPKKEKPILGYQALTLDQLWKKEKQLKHRHL